MATQSPSTYSTKEVKLFNPIDSRSGFPDKDVDLVNGFFEKATKDDEPQWYKRSGCLNYIGLSSAGVRGFYFWEDANKIVVAISNNVFIYNSISGALILTLAGVFSTTTGEVGFSEFLYDTNIVKLVVTDGTTLATLDTANVWVPSVDPDLPTPHLPQPQFIDGYLFLVKSGTADIYNSNLNDPLLYTPGDFISCEMFPDVVTRFAKLNNYLLAFGSSSIEYFWDAANPTGSPLQRNDTPVKLVGYLGGFAQNANKIYFVGNSSTTTPEVYVLEDFKIEPMSSPALRRYMGSLSNVSAYVGSIVSLQGHDFYVLNFGPNTHVAELQSKQWYRWKYQQQENFPIEHAVSVPSSTTSSTVFYVNGSITLMKFVDEEYQDIGTNFTSRIVTAADTYGTLNRKFASRLAITADRPDTDQFIDVSWSDDDYQTFSTPRSVNLNQDIPSLERGGLFRKRAYKFEYTANAPLRLQTVELDINSGNT